MDKILKKRIKDSYPLFEDKRSGEFIRIIRKTKNPTSAIKEIESQIELTTDEKHLVPACRWLSIIKRDYPESFEKAIAMNTSRNKREINQCRFKLISALLLGMASVGYLFYIKLNFPFTLREFTIISSIIVTIIFFILWRTGAPRK